MLGRIGAGMAVKLWQMTGYDPVVEHAAKDVPIGSCGHVRAS
jgi:hypothetical protein